LKYLNLKSATFSTNFTELINNLLSTNILICLDNELNQNSQKINCYNKDDNIISNDNEGDYKCYMNNSMMAFNNKIICGIC
jgi:hypothetical protein